MSAERPFVTVVVPVWRDSSSLAACLAALARQTWPADRREVLVVDNGDGGVPEGPGHRVLREEEPGSYAARNRGIREARGEVIAFTDADCVPAPDWLERGAAPLSDPAVGMVAGRIRITFLDPARPTAVERYESVASFRQEHYLLGRRFGATANVLTTRAVLEAVGSFDPRLKSLGDVDWGVRVFEAGYGQVYADDACVDHPARRTLAEFRARSARMTGGFRDLGRTGRWPLGKRLRYASTGLPPLGGILRHPSVLLVGSMVVLIRVVTLLRLLSGGRSGR